MGCTQSEISPQNEAPRAKSCTDVLWLVIYVLFWILMVSLYSFRKETLIILYTPDNISFIRG